MADKNDRREFLARTVLGTAGAAAALSLEERILLAALQEGAPQKSQAPADDRPMPYGQIGKLKISRMIIGGNLIGGWAHSRDLLYVSRLFKAYNTDEKVFETLALCESHGINTVQLDPACINVFHRYLTERGGKMQALVCIHPDADAGKVKSQIEDLLSKGATFLYTHGEATDRQTMAGRLDILAKTIELIKQAGVPAGIGSHSLETPMQCEAQNVGADFYVKTFHHDQYWSATTPENRQEWCWYLPQGHEAGSYHDNMWCLDWKKTAEFFKTVKKPWIAFKVLAAGAIHPRMGFPFALRNGADFVIVGMFDFQVAEDVAMFKDAYYKVGNQREREWYA
ncbi:MAG: hypothetical protein H5U08_03005 [Thermogutta sp.]|uniref:hypothetical protein n=1 Tax=Thermogutta sp. TaxID=1962930 RepID=UPI0019BF6952|nr:hypothetical protein [Thermogutta sp.]MBC7351302.1 hypothetical protein [Thermogutta sp.]